MFLVFFDKASCLTGKTKIEKFPWFAFQMLRLSGLAAQQCPRPTGQSVVKRKARHLKGKKTKSFLGFGALCFLLPFRCLGLADWKPNSVLGPLGTPPND